MSQQPIDPEIQELAEKLFNAAREGDAAVLAAYIDQGIPPNLTNGKGDTLLILAAYHEHLEAVQVLLARGADTDRVNDNGQTALGSAVVRKAGEIVTALLDAGADPAAGHRSAADIARFFKLEEMLALLELRGAS
jgi:ankyrin repeat protein